MDVLIDDLRVLGFADSAMNSRSFDVRNVKLFEKIIHFLITAISPESIQTWPVMYRNDELPFRKEVVNYFKCLNDPNLPAAEVSILVSNSSGPKCVDFLVKFAKYVLEEKIKELDSSWIEPVFDTGSSSAIAEDKLKILSQFYENETLTKIGFFESETAKCEAYYQQLLAENKRLNKQLDQTRKEISKKEADVHVQFDSEALNELGRNLEECLSILGQTEAYVQSVNYTLNKQSKSNGSELQGISANDLNVQVPKSLNSFLQHEQNRRITEQPLYEAEKLNLKTLASLANLSLEVYQEESPQIRIPRNELMATSSSRSSVENLEALKEQLDQLMISVDTQMSVLSSQLHGS